MWTDAPDARRQRHKLARGHRIGKAFNRNNCGCSVHRVFDERAVDWLSITPPGGATDSMR